MRFDIATEEIKNIFYHILMSLGRKKFLSYVANAFKEGDLAIVRRLKNPTQAYLTKPLKKGVVVQTHNGEFTHDDIIGKPKRVYLRYKMKEGKKFNVGDDKFIVTEPTLDEYTSLVKRLAQPIYSFDASILVQLADIDVDLPNVVKDMDVVKLGSEPKHFLEAGTGNGSLTLSICNAIHAANGLAKHYNDKSLRGAVLHSVDRNMMHSAVGKSNVSNYKNGRYFDDVEFYVSETPSAWLKEQNEQKEYPLPYLSGVFLDLPNPEAYLYDIAKHMKLEATLIVFCPSVTQILQCKKVIEDSRRTSAHECHNTNKLIDLTLTKTIELPPGNGGGTREWDVKTVFTRESEESVSICRPKVGLKVVGGGFVGVFKKSSVNGETFDLDNK